MQRHFTMEAKPKSGKRLLRSLRRLEGIPPGQGDWLLGQVFRDSFQDMPETGWFK